MGRTCLACRSPRKDEINAALAGGEPYRRLAARVGITEQSIRRHKAEHLPAAAVRAAEAVEMANADALLERIRELAEDAHRLKLKAERSGDIRTALDAVGRLTKIVELQARMAGELREQSLVVNVLDVPGLLRDAARKALERAGGRDERNR